MEISAKPLFTVVIPTHNRIETLVKVLDSYKKQTISKSFFEVIIVDDGSNDGTGAKVISIKDNYPFKIKYFRQENKGPAAARNVGIKNSQGDFIMFTGDDIIASPQLLREHLDVHKKMGRIAVLGYTPWHPSVKKTKFMDYLISNGHQFDYREIDNMQWEDCGKFNTSNISVNKYWFGVDMFDEDFKKPAFEDTELGYRLERKRLKMVYNKNAIGFHDHLISEEEFYNKTRMCGYYSAMMYKKHPQMKNMTLLKMKIVLAKVFLSPIKLYSWFFKKIGMDSLSWKVNIAYNAAHGVDEFLSKTKHF